MIVVRFGGIDGGPSSSLALSGLLIALVSFLQSRPSPVATHVPYPQALRLAAQGFAFLLKGTNSLQGTRWERPQPRLKAELRRRSLVLSKPSPAPQGSATAAGTAGTLGWVCTQWVHHGKTAGSPEVPRSKAELLAQ